MAPLCSKLVAAVSGSICIAVVSVSVGVIVLSEQAVVVAEGVSSKQFSYWSRPQPRRTLEQGDCARTPVSG